MVTEDDSVNRFIKLYCLLVISKDTTKLTSFDQEQKIGIIYGSQIYCVRLETVLKQKSNQKPNSLNF